MSLTRLSSLVRLREVSDTSDVLLICTWMGASPKLVQKYYDDYIRIFPRHSVLLITATAADMFLTSRASIDAALLPAVQLVQAKMTGKGNLVGAIYSNGGTHSLTAFARLWRKSAGSALPLTRLVIDSAPGAANDLAGGHRALITAFPASLRPFFSIFLWLALYTWKILMMIGLSENPIAKLRNALADRRLFAPWNEADEKASQNARTYIYSKEDGMVDSRAVESSAAASRRIGWKVKEERFDGSSHVAHAVKDRERYWDIIRRDLQAEV